jgi:hypothetical protein
MAPITLLSTALAISMPTLARQSTARVQSTDERHACQVAAELINAWINDRTRVVSFMATEAKDRYLQQQADFVSSGRRSDNRVTAAQVLSCSATASNNDIVVRQERRDQLPYTSTGRVGYVMYGANCRVSPKSWLVEAWQEIAE